MFLDFENFSKARNTVEKIISKEGVLDIRKELNDASNDVPNEMKREFYRHMNSLFLNVLVNRVEDLGKEAETKSIKAKKIILEIMNNL